MPDTPRSSLPVSPNLPQPREVVMPDFTSNVYVPIFANLTGNISTTAQMAVVWNPVQSRFVLRGGYVFAYCSVNCTGADGTGNLLAFWDDAFPKLALPLGVFQSNATIVNEIVCGTHRAGTPPKVYGAPWHFDLGRGYRSLAKGNQLRVGGSSDIGTGNIVVSGMVWGVQE